MLENEALFDEVEADRKRSFV
ncbi:Putative uncharacterized protein [Lactobacillus delbrueckii subsp. lactis]|nr:Putative uncharacterized protein [Lactobacillus delbrueckii subsp. lactis]